MESWLKLIVVAVIVLLIAAWIINTVNTVKRWWRNFLAWLAGHRGAILTAAVTLTVAAGAVFFLLQALPLLGLGTAVVPATVEAETTVASSWSTGNNGIRASRGVALTLAAARGEAEGVVWQNWMVPLGTNELVQRLQPNHSYLFNLALTPGEVKLTGAQATVASARAQEAVRQALLTQNRVVLSTVFLADPERLTLQPGESAENEFVIDVPRLLTDRSEVDGPEQSVDATVERAFGRVVYGVQTGAASGWTKASVLLLANNRAIDQIVTTQCIGECTEPRPSGRVSGSPRLYALMQEAPPADISLYLTELEPGTLHGVLRSQTPVNGRSLWVWSTTRGTTGFANLLRKSIGQLYKDFDSREELLVKGDNLSDLVFADTAEGAEALEAFRQLVIESSKWQLGDGIAPKSLFVHFDFADADEGPMIVPIGLMTYADAAGQREFVGHQLMIEQPMMVPHYGRPAQCASNWVALMPDAAAAKDALYLARSAVQQLGTKWPVPERFREFNDIEEFKSWLRVETETQTTVVTTLSHHDSNLLYFQQGGPSIVSPNVRRSFGPASIAILNGCGTGKSGAMDFVVRFNRHGVDSAIVSAFDVNGAIAGTYLACLRQALARGTLSIASAHFQAINECHWNSEHAPDAGFAISSNPPPKLLEETYAANALKYVLVGNSASTICQ